RFTIKTVKFTELL
ncbi:inner membrane oxaA domain protein, partial [Chlamydia psittaci 84-8471/1]